MRVQRRKRRLAAAALWLLCLAGPTATAEAPPDNGAVVLMYHRFGEDSLPETNIRLAQFEAHLAELASGPYRVLPLARIVEALDTGATLPPRSLAITIDDAYLSVYREGWPRLRAAGLPFTLFVASEPLDQGLPGYMSWDQLREMAGEDGVDVGAHSHTHTHLADLQAAKAQEEILVSRQRLEAELGRAIELFAYPYGEFGLEIQELTRAAGFAAAFGQHSGAIARNADRFALPRFSLNERYGNMERFRLAIEALPLPVTDLRPADALVPVGAPPPTVGFTLLRASDGPVGCFFGGAALTLRPADPGSVVVQLPQTLAPGRHRINCTAPGPEGRFRWFGRQFTVPGRE